jgi:hypothetical protein
MVAARRAATLEVWITVIEHPITVIEHPVAFRAEPPVRLVKRVFVDVVCEDQLVFQAFQVVLGIFGGMVVAPGARAFLPKPVKKHPIAFKATPPICLVVGIFWLIVRQNIVNRHATWMQLVYLIRRWLVLPLVCRADTLFGVVAVPEHPFALLATSPIPLVKRVFAGVVRWCVIDGVGLMATAWK